MTEIKLEVGRRERAFKGWGDGNYFEAWTPASQEANTEQTTEKSSKVEPSSNPLQFQPGDVLVPRLSNRQVLTTETGEEWEVVGWIDKKNNDAFAIRPKPKRLKGSIRVYRDAQGYDIYVGERATAVPNDWTHIATIKLSDFEEGHGL